MDGASTVIIDHVDTLRIITPTAERKLLIMAPIDKCKWGNPYSTVHVLVPLSDSEEVQDDAAY